MKTATSDQYEIHLPLFEGPFDLLLFFIERDELDIHDIPISKITSDFLDYIHGLEVLNMEVASEFILMAATLMRIKSKMLLPRPKVNEEGLEIDPREDLVKHLLEYRKYKSVVEQFQQMEDTELKKEKRGNVLKEVRQLAELSNVEAELQDVDMYKLMAVYERVVKRFHDNKNKPIHQVIQYPYTIEGQRNYIMESLTKKTRLSFVELIEEMPTRIGFIFNFLAILDMLAMGQLTIQIGEGYNNFWIAKKENSVETVSE